ncbi:tetratricopeptide repeat protein, partial [Candidatus Dependentiae bacterium]|nr:tetratricopeptide repeat protein [Candidatus Dependentiae bacterium]
MINRIRYKDLKNIITAVKIPHNDVTVIESVGFKEIIIKNKDIKNDIIHIADSEKVNLPSEIFLKKVLTDYFLLNKKECISNFEWISGQIDEYKLKIKPVDYKNSVIQNLLSQFVEIINDNFKNKTILFQFSKVQELDLFSFFVIRKILDDNVSFNYAFVFDHRIVPAVKSEKLKYENYVEKLFYVLEFCIALKFWAKAVALVDKLLKLANKISDEHLKGQIIFRAGMIYVRRGLMKKAENYYSLSQKIFEKINDVENWIKSTNSLGNIYITLEKYSVASELFKQALSISEEKQEDYSLAVIYGSMGNVQIKVGNFNEAIDYLYKSLVFTARGGYFHNVQLVYGFLGEAYMGLRNYKKAQYYFKIAYKFSCLEKSQINQGNNTMRIGKLYSVTGDIQECKIYYKKSLLIFKKINYLYG